MWTALALIVASFLLSALFTPKVTPPPPASQDEFEFPVAEEGTPQAVYFGETWCTGWMVLAHGDYRNEGIEGDSGGK